MTVRETPFAEASAVAREGMAAQVPAQALATFDAEQVKLGATDIGPGIAEPGSPMPDGALLDVRGDATTLERVRAGRSAVVVFYRGAWCPFCNAALRVYEQELATELDARGIALIAVSPQKPDGSLTMQETHQLSYHVVSDPGSQIGGKLGIVTQLFQDVKQAQLSLGLDLTEVNADGTYDIVMPTVTIVDADGILRWIDVRPNYAARTEPAEILAALSATVG